MDLSATEMLLSPTTNEGSAFTPLDSSLLQMGGMPASDATPRRKLSLSIEESVCSSDFEKEDAGYAEEICSSKPCYQNLLRQTHSRTPLSEVSNLPTLSNPTRTTRNARRMLASKNSQSVVDKENPSFVWKNLPQLSAHVRNTRVVCDENRPVSLPAFPLSPLAKQISSPLQRMSLKSPSVTSNESDGYSSEVFDENTQDGFSTAEFSSSQSSSSLASSPKATIFVDKPHAEGTILCPTPVRPNVSLPKFDSWPQPSIPERRGSLKRSSPSSDHQQKQKPKRPPLPVIDSPDKRVSKNASLIQRSYSCIPAPLNDFPFSPGNGEVDLIGDNSKPYALPVLQGAGGTADLKCIDPSTLAKLIRGEYTEEVDEFVVVDCRYPYEYEGGHIKNAINLWDKDEILKRYFQSPALPTGDKRSIVIFHCEFSSKRGPEMSRFMREHDRNINGMTNFPKLYYPELYLLHGGYKAFFEQYCDLCEPISYRKMVDDQHKDELKLFQRRSKTWDGESAANKRRHHPPQGKCRRATMCDLFDSHSQ
eukprot:Em0013g252a